MFILITPEKVISSSGQAKLRHTNCWFCAQLHIIILLSPAIIKKNGGTFGAMDNSIIKRITALLAEGFEVDESVMTPDANLKETLDLDSLDYIDLIALTEANFGCKIAHEDLTGLTTFQDLYDYISTHAGQKMIV